tara:strand:- start:339 stop:545 length:207 start_codon:yes stop_codon:yes gene_type:complete
MYDKTKLSEYKFRAIVSIFLLCLLSYLVMFDEVKGPAIFEIAFIGGLFSVSSLFHSTWAIKMILKEEE